MLHILLMNVCQLSKDYIQLRTFVGVSLKARDSKEFLAMK